jgi:hypothetical protein
VLANLRKNFEAKSNYDWPPSSDLRSIFRTPELFIHLSSRLSEPGAVGQDRISLADGWKVDRIVK